VQIARGSKAWHEAENKKLWDKEIERAQKVEEEQAAWEPQWNEFGE
jgi:hypothetical protein